MDANRLTAVLLALIERTDAVRRELGQTVGTDTVFPTTVADLYSAIVEEDKLLKRCLADLESRKTLTDAQQAQIESIIAEHHLERDTDEDWERELRVVNSLDGRALTEYAQRIGMDIEKYRTQNELRAGVCQKVKDRDLA